MPVDGSVVCGYRIQRMLGSRGMGAVYLAADPALPRAVALKVLSAELCRDPDFRARFVREADTAAGLEHPQIVSVYNRGQTDDGQLWIAMQFIDGTDADGALRAGATTPHRAVHIITEVAKALDFAHAHHIIHRDIKPANILLSGPPSADERIYLGDFGIARPGRRRTDRHRLGRGHRRLHRTRSALQRPDRSSRRHLPPGLHPVPATDRPHPLPGPPTGPPE